MELGRVGARVVGSGIGIGGVGGDERGRDAERQAWTDAENLAGKGGMSFARNTVQRLNQFCGVVMGVFHGSNRVGVMPASASDSLTR